MQWRRFAKPSSTPKQIAEAKSPIGSEASRPERPGLQEFDIGDIRAASRGSKSPCAGFGRLGEARAFSPLSVDCIHSGKIWPHLLSGRTRSIRTQRRRAVRTAMKGKEAFSALEPSTRLRSCDARSSSGTHKCGRRGDRRMASIRRAQLWTPFICTTCRKAPDRRRRTAGRGGARRPSLSSSNLANDTGSPSCIASTAGSRSSAVRRISTRAETVSQCDRSRARPRGPGSRGSHSDRSGLPAPRRIFAQGLRTMFEPILAAIEEGEELPDVRKARALLAELA